jgi:chorismate-pyruvate lyase
MGFLAQLNGFDPASLTLLQRVLLATDGTLTDVLEAAFLERILLVKISVNVQPAASRVPELDLDAGQPLMHREILLRGAKTGTNFVYAESELAVDRLHPKFRDSLIGSAEPIGRLWSDYRIETWKRILDVHRLPAGDLSGHFSCGQETRLLARRYCVYAGGLPTILTTEYFPEKYHTQEG